MSTFERKLDDADDGNRAESREAMLLEGQQPPAENLDPIGELPQVTSEQQEALDALNEIAGTAYTSVSEARKFIAYVNSANDDFIGETLYNLDPRYERVLCEETVAESGAEQEQAGVLWIVEKNEQRAPQPTRRDWEAFSREGGLGGGIYSKTALLEKLRDVRALRTEAGFGELLDGLAEDPMTEGVMDYAFGDEDFRAAVNTLKEQDPYPGFNADREEARKIEARELQQRREMSAAFQRDLDAFGAFLTRHEENIARMQEGGMNMKNIIYQFFYSQNPDSPYLMKEHEEVIAKEFAAYKQSVAEVFDELGEEAQGNDQLRTDHTEQFKFSFTHDSQLVPNSEDIGRVYMNVENLMAPDFYQKLVERCLDKGLAAQIKLSDPAQQTQLGRSENIVFYFTAENEVLAMEIVQEVYAENKNLFEGQETPRFVADVRDRDGVIMEGVGFAQEPLQAGESYGFIRAEILATMLAQVEREGKSFGDVSVHRTELFKKVCAQYGVDGANPAFNTGGRERFPGFAAMST